MNLASFDIFDTALIRKCGKPEMIFRLLALRLFPYAEDRQNQFYLKRANANGCKLRDRYLFNPNHLWDLSICEEFNEYDIETLISTEVTIESENLVPNPEILEIIERHRQKGDVIKFISDMYLPSNVLKKILIDKGCAKECDEVIVSCEWEEEKSSGRLYQLVQTKFTPHVWHHYGDNKISDYLNPKRHGIKSHLIDTGFTDFEQELIEDSIRLKDGWQLALLAGYSRSLRISHGNNPYLTLSADFVAPTLVPYVRFILKTCREQKINKLHFLSRDAYILMKIAESLNDGYFDINYLFVSRRSLLPGYIANISEDEWLNIKETPHFGNLCKSIDVNLKTISFDQLQSIFSDQSDLIKKYFIQNGLDHNSLDSSAIIDIGWGGISRLFFNKIFSSYSDNLPVYFYYAVSNRVLHASIGKYYTFTKEYISDTAMQHLLESYFVLSPYNSTLNYKQNSENVIPVLEEGTDAKLNALKSNIVACQEMANLLNQEPFLKDEILSYWSKKALDYIINLKGNIDISPLLDSTDIDGKPFIKKLTIKELWNFFIKGKSINCDFTKGSLYYSLGNKLYPILKHIHR